MYHKVAALEMSTATTLAFEQWQILFHEAMAAVLRAQRSVKRHVGYWGIAANLWKVDRDLRALINLLKTLSETPDGLISQDEIRSQIQDLRNLLLSIEDLIDNAKRKGLMNRTLTSASLGSMRIRGEDLADYVENLEMAVDPEVTAAIAAGREQIAKGDFETIDWPS